MRVMWEPHLESETLIDEFVHGYYGEAVAPLIKQYWNVLIAQEGKFDLYLEGLKAGFIAQKNPPDICKGVPEDAWVIFDALSFNNYNHAATIIDDPAGWNGKSVRMGTKVDWNTNYTPPVRGKYRILASLRCEGTIQEGRLGSWGVYDPQGKKSLKSMTLNFTDFAAPDGSFDKEFRWIDLGAVDFVPGAYFWFAHGHRPELDAIFVDRVVLIGAE